MYIYFDLRQVSVLPFDAKVWDGFSEPPGILCRKVTEACRWYRHANGLYRLILIIAGHSSGVWSQKT